jgi:xanthine dehydrogenase accessory factor
MRDILSELIRLLDQGQDCVVCTLAETRGSTPQKAGATMLVLPDGQQRGTLGGGCVEAEVKQRALRALSSGKPELLTFHLDDNYGWDDGLICGGRMCVVAQPLQVNESSAEAARYFRRYHHLVLSGLGCTEALALQGSSGTTPGRRFLFDAESAMVSSLPGGHEVPSLRDLLVPVIQRPKTYVRQGLAFLPVLPRIRLLIVGGGHVGQAVGRLAAEADFDVWVLDDREQYASRERFPLAERLIVGDIGARLKELCERDLTPSTYCVIVTRGHAHDEEALYHLATTPAGYVGMIGSKRKIRLIFDDLIAKGIPRELLARVHAPLGLNIGSQTVPEIAVSIVAELIAHRNLGSVPAGAREPFIISVAPS